MSEFKGTPGPWEYAGSYGQKYIGHRDGFIMMSNYPHNQKISATERDWKLIAAAPDLLEALNGLLADIEEYQQINKLGGENNHWQVISRAAIAKALGEQK